MKLEINNLVKIKIDKKFFSTVAKKVLSGENKKIKSLSLALVDKEEMKKLNKKFRKKNKPTDVLSFELREPENIDVGGNYLGEIVICPDVVKENARKYGVTIKQEMKRVFVHGILHLLGYNHEKFPGCNVSELKKEAEIMKKKEKKYL